MPDGGPTCIDSGYGRSARDASQASQRRGSRAPSRSPPSCRGTNLRAARNSRHPALLLCASRSCKCYPSFVDQPSNLHTSTSSSHATANIYLRVRERSLKHHVASDPTRLRCSQARWLQYRYSTSPCAIILRHSLRHTSSRSLLNVSKAFRKTSNGSSHMSDQPHRKYQEARHKAEAFADRGADRNTTRS